MEGHLLYSTQCAFYNNQIKIHNVRHWISLETGETERMVEVTWDACGWWVWGTMPWKEQRRNWSHWQQITLCPKYSHDWQMQISCSHAAQTCNEDGYRLLQCTYIIITYWLLLHTLLYESFKRNHESISLQKMLASSHTHTADSLCITVIVHTMLTVCSFFVLSSCCSTRIIIRIIYQH